MTSDKPVQDLKTAKNRRIYLLVPGFFLLGIALAFLLFGNRLIAAFSPAESDGLDQITLGERIESGEIPVPADGAPLNVGDKAHSFSLEDLNGTLVNLDDFRGQPVVVNFWATWCPPCRLEMPEFQRVYDDRRDEGLVILAVNEGENPDVVRSFFYDEMGFTYTPLLDKDVQVGELYGAIGLPATFFIDGDGQVTTIHRGLLTAEQLERYLAEMGF